MTILGFLSNKKPFQRGKIRLFDGANRDNNNLTVGNTETGQPWVVEGGTWGIIDNQIYSSVCVSGGRIVADSFISNGIITAKISNLIPHAITNHQGIVFRAQDINNHLVFRFREASWVLSKRVDGLITDLSSDTCVFASGDVFTIRLEGELITILCNNILLTTYNISEFSMATNCGLYINSTLPIDVRFDYMEVVQL